MDLFAILFFACISVLFGVVLTLCVQYYIIYIYLRKSPIAKPPNRHDFIDYNLPEALKKQLEKEDLKENEKGCSLPISLVLQFLFHELRHSDSVKRWLYKKLSMELDELLTKTTIGKFFESINIKDMHLGTQFPDVKDITVDNVKLDKKEGHIDVVSLCLDLDYTGNFLLSVEAKMKFGKTAYLSIKVKRICGNARLQFSRHPYTHWSFSFFTDPILDLAVESHFQGRQLQSNITNLIVNQIKKAIKRKHTLPNYKIRYKPFFVKTDPSQLDTEDSEIVPQGQLDLTCVEISRLSIPDNIVNVYCTISVDTIPWISVYQQDDSIFMILEITVTKLRQAQLGVIFKQDQGLVTVDSVAPHSCAFRSGLRAGDVVLAVENKVINSVPQVAKLIKSVSTANITLRVRRSPEYYFIKTKYNEYTDSNSTPELEEVAEVQDSDSFVFIENVAPKPPDVKKPKFGSMEKLKTTPDKVVPKIIPTNENMSKLAQTIGNFSLRKRKTSISDRASSESSAKNTPTSSNPSTPQHMLKQQMSTPCLSAKKHSICELPEIKIPESEVGANDAVMIYKGKELPASAVIQFKEDHQFILKDGMKYLNINVWGTVHENPDVLLGYTNIPLSHVLNECCNSVLGHYIRCYSFLPPTVAAPTNQTHPLLSHSGFEHVFCYGDILLSFVWTHDEDIELKRKMSTVLLDDDDKSSDSFTTTTTKHDFIRTQFHRTTQCDFCTKKIWLKDAVQCRQCGLCCHKKCIVKCQMSTGCNPNDRNGLKSEIPDIMLQPEMSEASEEFVTTETINQKDSSASSSNLKRVNSVNNLAIPGAQFVANSSRSLPPSPQRTPSRKQSLVVINPFSMCPSVLEEIQKRPEEASENVNKLLEQIMLCPPDETLMDAAKETGRQFYVGISHEDKIEKINLMMAELKKTLDSVTTEHMELSKKMGIEENEVEKAKLAFLMGQADAKVHGLSVLMLHYCSSLQHTQEKII